MNHSQLKSFVSRVSPKERGYRQKRSLPDEDLFKIYEQIVQFKPVHAVVEIGTFRGWSSLWMAAAAAEHNVPFYSIDIDPRAGEALGEFLGPVGLPFQFVLGDSVSVLDGWEKNNPLNLDRDAGPNVWFIDGFHSHAYAKREAMFARKWIGKSRGLIFFDDATAVHPQGQLDGGVPKAAKEVGAVPLAGAERRVAVWRVGE